MRETQRNSPSDPDLLIHSEPAFGSGQPLDESSSLDGRGQSGSSRPVFKPEDDEMEFWATHDSIDTVDRSEAEPMLFPDLKPSVRSISLRLPVSMIASLKALANQRDVPYQSLLKVFLSERLKQEWAAKRSR
jgi:predicted DNA binding CopG/RHH family protein